MTERQIRRSVKRTEVSQPVRGEASTPSTEVVSSDVIVSDLENRDPQAQQVLSREETEKARIQAETEALRLRRAERAETDPKQPVKLEVAPRRGIRSFTVPVLSAVAGLVVGAGAMFALQDRSVTAWELLTPNNNYNLGCDDGQTINLRTLETKIFANRNHATSADAELAICGSPVIIERPGK